MGYEVLFFIPLIWLISAVIIHYSSKIRTKYILIILTVIFTFFYCFISPGPLWIKKTPPYIYWYGDSPKRQVENVKKRILRGLEKIGFEFVE